MQATPRILIVGSYGQVGQRIAADLAPQYPGQVVVAERDIEKAGALAERLGHALRLVRLDINDPEAVEAALGDVSLVVNCIDQAEPHLLRAVIRRGLAYADITAHLDFWGAALALDGEARKSGARILLGAGLIPGIANVLARAGADRWARLRRWTPPCYWAWAIRSARQRWITC